MRLTVFFALLVMVGVVVSLPAPLRDSLQMKKYEQWPGVEDERLADAELDNAYKIFRYKTQKPIIMNHYPQSVSKREPAKINAIDES